VTNLTSFETSKYSPQKQEKDHFSPQVLLTIKERGKKKKILTYLFFHRLLKKIVLKIFGKLNVNTV